LWLFGIFFGYLVYFSPFWYCVPRKIWQPWFGLFKKYFSHFFLKYSQQQSLSSSKLQNCKDLKPHIRAKAGLCAARRLMLSFTPIKKSPWISGCVCHL
jgi:hypothetical protein